MKNDDANEEEVIKRIVGGETDMFRVLIDRYKDRSLSIVLSIIKDRDAADDILQEVFIKVYQNLSKFDSRSSFSTWLYRILINTANTAVVKSKRHQRISFENLEHFFGAESNGFEAATNYQRGKIIGKVLDSLAPNEALVLRLFYLGEQSIREVSEITGLTSSNVKVLLHRARNNFHWKLEQYLGPDYKNLL